MSSSSPSKKSGRETRPASRLIKQTGKASSATKRGGVPSGTGGGRRQVPWAMIAAAALVVALIGVLAYSIVPKAQERAEVQRFVPTADNQDPSKDIADVKTAPYKAALHVAATQRVAYDQSPPFGGPHDQVWANCMGTVYRGAIRTENAVHSLEHGAVWVAYNPDRLSADQVAALSAKVQGNQYTLMSPYPGLDRPVSLQSWGHQLKLDDPSDPRVDQFITALRLNRYQYPEVGASCSTTPATFDTDNPPPFDPTPPGPDAVPMDGAGLTPDGTENTVPSP